MTEYEKLTDEELVELAKSGDENSESELLYRHKKTVKSISRNYFLISGEKEDLVQEGMIAVFKAIHSYNADKNASFKTFVVLCVKRHMIDVVRRTSHDAPVFANVDDETADNEVDFSPFWADVRKSLNDVDNKILDAFLDGLSYAEIAALLDTTVKKVDNELQKIKRIIKKTNDSYQI